MFTDVGSRRKYLHAYLDSLRQGLLQKQTSRMNTLKQNDASQNEIKIERRRTDRELAKHTNNCLHAIAAFDVYHSITGAAASEATEQDLLAVRIEFEKFVPDERYHFLRLFLNC